MKTEYRVWQDDPNRGRQAIKFENASEAIQHALKNQELHTVVEEIQTTVIWVAQDD